MADRDGWIGVDFDGTLAEYHGWREELGEPLLPMVERVKTWLTEGRDVRVLTARVSIATQAMRQTELIEDWCELHLGRRLPVTCIKDYQMIELWDDRAVRVIRNVGTPCCEPKGAPGE